MLKVSDYLKFIRSAYGYYWFGTFGQKASQALFNEKKKQYPNQYKASDFPSQIANPKPCYDCAGLVKSPFVYPKYNAAYDLGATGIYNKCKNKGDLKSESQLKPGYLVFKGNAKTKSHVAVYLGNGKIKEAKGHAYGIVESSLDLSKYKFWAEYYAVDYSEAPAAPVEELKTGDILIVSIKYNSSYLSLRAYASTSAPTLKKMKKGTKVTYLGERSGSWLKVSCGNLIGWACQHESGKDYDYLTKV